MNIDGRKEFKMPPDPSLLLAHEDRISRIEDRQSEQNSDMAVLRQKVDDGFAVVIEKLGDLKETFATHAIEDKVTALTVQHVAERVETMEKKKKLRADHWASAAKYGWAFFLVMAGALAKVLFDRFSK